MTVLLAVPGCFDPEATPLPGPTTDGDPTTGGPPTAGPSGDPQDGDDSMDALESSSSGTDPETEDEGPVTTDDDASSDDGGPVGPPPCGDGAGLCASAPAGWSGPVRLVETATDAAPDCDGAAAMVTAHTELEAPPASCSCDCAAATGASCTSATLSAWGGDGTCSDDEAFSQEVFPPSQETCNFMPSGAEGEIPLTNINYWSVTTQSQGGSCTPQASRSVLPAAYQTSVHGCDVPELDMPCENGAACYEAPDDGPLCVWREGEHECPGDGFSVRDVYYRGEPDDTRECTTCTCGTPEGSCPSTTVDMFIGYYCNAPVVGTIGACTGLCAGPGCETYALSAVLDLGPAVAECDPVGGNATGGVTETDPVTFCCSE